MSDAAIGRRYARRAIRDRISAAHASSLAPGAGRQVKIARRLGVSATSPVAS